MTDKELKHLSRAELLQMLLDKTREADRLRKQMGQTGAKSGEAGNKVENREIKLKKTSSTAEQLETELARVDYRRRYHSTLRSTIYALITVAACSVLIATLLLPVLQIYGNSMTPTISEGQIVVAVKGSKFEQGDIIAFYLNNKILVKRLIAGPGDWVDIDEKGNVYVNGKLLDEPYLSKKALGECDLELPYQVGEDRYFVMGDHRSTSVDSRSTTVGCVAEEQIVGKIVFRVWPLSKLGLVN